MGPGEDYYDEFYRWFSNLSAAEQAHYALNNPPPVDWVDLYEIIKEHPWI
ncbi:hypothetical protein NX02_02855 [Sphingomonas sanxanigenens DSM 19645 = NX02]|uniref:Uncharacterized protein n=1 Tax=Sphingomonas sanxanigenens DSM 19645 = NX02 TaxID=1123269 RepID=W0A302_9SPHN|nr:hypothetical protein NX02_02855 [Sphingomonas sanxanigenens DSM 19645 = NX02]